MVAGLEGEAGDGAEVVGAPGGLFGGFDEDGVPAEEGGDDGGDEVVELVVGVSGLGEGGGKGSGEGRLRDSCEVLARWSIGR